MDPAELMGVSTRHARRITTAYREEGAAALDTATGAANRSTARIADVLPGEPQKNCSSWTD